MFEGQQQNQNLTQSAPVQPAPAAPGGVEDIFASTDETSASALRAQSGAPSAPIIPGPPTALAGGKLKPLAESAAGIPAGQASSAAGAGFPFKKLSIIVFVSLGIIGLAAVAFAVLQGRANVAVPVPQPGAPEEAAAPDASSASAVSGNAEDADRADGVGAPPDTGGILRSFQQGSIDRALNPIPQDPASIDTDQDGLSDAQEFGNGTNPRLVDSDSDGLSDWEEIAIFGTDPLNRDSDADSYADGEEVQNGYNPLGQGKLLNVEQTNQGVQ
ncbi:MAG: hypothetical protein HYT31_01735 [Parcubacteria group bacterium]|nr:hypothetical protein [Parcubacteria group bacterium]